MNWFKKLFAASPHGRSLPEYVRMSMNKNISEPIYSFVECVINDPKRFNVSFRYTDVGTVWYTIKDNRTKESWKISIYRPYSEDFTYVRDKPSFITDDEALYLFKEIYSVYYVRVKRKQDILQKRADRTSRKERKRLMEIYK